MNEEYVRYIHGSRTRLASGQEIYRSELTGRASLYNASDLTAVASCAEFATLAAHAERIAGNGRPLEQCRMLLRRAADEGILMRETGARERVSAGLVEATGRGPIDCIAIPTRNRPVCLARLLSELESHLATAGRQAAVMVMDDSPSLDMQHANRAAIRSVGNSGSISIRHGTRATRAAFVHELSRAGIPIETACFALTGSKAFPVSIGASRNALLLETAGRRSLFMDDDVRCRVARAHPAPGRIVFGAPTHTVRFIRDRAELERLEFTGEDLLALHEAALNIDRPAAEQRADLSKTGARLFKRIEGRQSSVRISLMGIAGDSGADHPLGLFLQGPDNFGRMVDSEATYDFAISNRLILRTPDHAFVNDEVACQSHCMAVDQSEPMPPFMPVQRAEEHAWLGLVHRILPGALFSAIPRAILHQPVESRSYAPDATSRYAAKFNLGETLLFLLSVEPVRGESARSLLQSLASRFSEFANQRERDFRDYLNRIARPRVVEWIERLDLARQHGMQGSQASPGFAARVQRDLTAIVDECLRCLNERDYSVPLDLEQLYGMHDGARVFQKVLLDYSKMLAMWTDIVEASALLRARGHAICCPVEHP